jgi:hypothetical protein
MSDDENIIDNDQLLERLAEQLGKQGRKLFDEPDLSDVVNLHNWLHVFGLPSVFRGLSRMPPREHILRLVDVFIAYARRGDHYLSPQFEPVEYDKREPLALRFRRLLEAWSPPDLPSEMTELARAILHADGQAGPPNGWDNTTSLDPSPGVNVEEILLWPEGIPYLLRMKGQTCETDK